MRLSVFGGGASELRIEQKLITIQVDTESRAGLVEIIERNRLRSYNLKIDLGGVSWAIKALRQVWSQHHDRSFFSKYTSSSAVFWVQKYSNKGGIFVEVSKWEAGVKRNNIIIPAGVDGQGWQAMAKMLERVIHGGNRVSDVERNVRSTDKGSHNINKQSVFSSRRGNLEGNRFTPQKTGANRVVSYADVLKSRSIISEGNDFCLEMRKVVVCTRTDFFDDWVQIEQELNRSFKSSIVLRPFQLNKALFFAKSSEEADYYGEQGLCFFHKSIAVRLERWSEKVFSKDTVIVSNGNLDIMRDLPFDFWKDRVFEWIGSKCGGLIEVDRRTRNFGNLFEARLKVRGYGNGFLPAKLHVQLDGISVVVRLKALSKLVGRREVRRRWSFSGEPSTGEGEDEEPQGTSSTRGSQKMRRQLGDMIDGDEDNGGISKVDRGRGPGKNKVNGLLYNYNGPGKDVGSTHEVLVSGNSFVDGPQISAPDACHTHKDKGPIDFENLTIGLPLDRGPNIFKGPKVSFANPIVVSESGFKQVTGFDGEEGLRSSSAMKEVSQFPPCEGSTQVDRAIQPIRREMYTEEIHSGLANIVDRSMGDLQGFNGRTEAGIQELMEVIRSSEKQINEVEEGHFEIHKVLQNLEDYGSSTSSESKSEGEISEGEQVDSDWDLNRFFHVDCTTLDEDFGKAPEALNQASPSATQGSTVSPVQEGLHVVPDFSYSGDGVQGGKSLPLQSNSFCTVQDVSFVDTVLQGVTADIPRATVMQSTSVSESLCATISQGQMNDSQCRISRNHFDKGGQGFSGEKEETERWLNELSKYATCLIEESEIPHFLQLLQVIGLSLVRIKDMFGSGRVSNRSTRGSAVRKEGDSSKKGARELKNLASSVNYERRSAAGRGDKCSHPHHSGNPTQDSKGCHDPSSGSPLSTCSGSFEPSSNTIIVTNSYVPIPYQSVHTHITLETQLRIAKGAMIPAQDRLCQPAQDHLSQAQIQLSPIAVSIPYDFKTCYTTKIYIPRLQVS
ncbi:hypothetical protein LOK49_LG05G01071 [Camellia lanceoleosa]|uniref:Uncharacterized protein n=1 Tax=Camellia lanceoleosa TaxID=1840588 RepID=A0ACC0HUL7_9ERIC|nr:hypothetical protein LOK49_LG05G01071 [Camellia lanceoleosa]